MTKKIHIEDMSPKICASMLLASKLLLIASVVICDSHDKICSQTPSDIKMDTALLSVVNDKTKNITLSLYQQSSECHLCNLTYISKVGSRDNCSWLVDTRWKTRLEIRPESGKLTKSCLESELTSVFLENGIYSIFITINADNLVTCTQPQLMNDPPDANIPIYVAMGIGVGVALIWIFFKDLYRRGTLHRLLCCCYYTDGMMVDLGSPTNINAADEHSQSSQDDKKVKKERLKSLDAFRGISIVIMIFVNYHGGYYWFFKHSKWNGLTVADLVFPWFVFIMGTAMAYSFSGQLRRGYSKKFMLWKVFKRSCILFLLGLLINSGDYPKSGVVLDDFRIPGVLQRFAGTYLITATVHVFFTRANDSNRDCWWAPVRDIVDYWPEWIINLLFVTIHLLLTFHLPVPDCPTGYIGPGGQENQGQYWNCTGGSAGYIDRLVFGDNHIYEHPTSKEIYHSSIPYDPEGLLGTLNSCFLCFLGLQAGKILLIHKDWVLRIKRLLLWGVFTGSIATLLCKASKDDGWIPINKNLWSLSFVLALACMAFVLLTICYLVIDVYPLWSGSPFYYPGMNAIVLYVGHEFFNRKAPVYFHVPHHHESELAINLWGTIFWVLVSYYLYYNDIFISI